MKRILITLLLPILLSSCKNCIKISENKDLETIEPIATFKYQNMIYGKVFVWQNDTVFITSRGDIFVK